MKFPQCLLPFFEFKFYMIEQCFDFDVPRVLGIYTDFRVAAKVHYKLTKAYHFEDFEQIVIHLVPCNVCLPTQKLRPQDILVWESDRGRKYISKSIRDKYLEWTTL